jgi:hypothetical protein
MQRPLRKHQAGFNSISPRRLELVRQLLHARFRDVAIGIA